MANSFLDKLKNLVFRKQVPTTNQNPKVEPKSFREVRQTRDNQNVYGSCSKPLYKTEPQVVPSQPQEDFLTSYLVAQTTNNTLVGYMTGGSLAGAMLGDSSVPDTTPAHSDSSSSHCDTGSSDYSSSSSDSSCSYDSGSSSSSDW